jgi:hypothetical protein
MLIHTVQTLLQVQELLKLMSHQTRVDVVPMKSCAELGPQHLVAVLDSGSEVGPPSTRRSTQLLGCKQSLLELSAVERSKLGLDDAKSVIFLQRISHLSKRQRVCRQKVIVESLHPRLAVGWVHLMLHEVLCQHPHELVLRGQQLLDTHGRWRWWWWRGSPVSNITKLIHCCPSMSV